MKDAAAELTISHDGNSIKVKVHTKATRTWNSEPWSMDVVSFCYAGLAWFIEINDWIYENKLVLWKQNRLPYRLFSLVRKMSKQLFIEFDNVFPPTSRYQHEDRFWFVGTRKPLHFSVSSHIFKCAIIIKVVAISFGRSAATESCFLDCFLYK